MLKKIFHGIRNAFAILGVFILAILAFFLVTNKASLGVMFSILALLNIYSLYYPNLSTGDVIQGASIGIVESLKDEYSYYLPKDDWESLQERLGGELVGIGVYITPSDDGNIVIVKPIDGSPAMEVGLETKDIILAIDGVPCTDYTFDEGAAALRGEEGTIVVVRVLKFSSGETTDISLTRRSVISPSVGSIMDDEYPIGYLYVAQFHNKTPMEIEHEVNKLKNEGAKGLILDLRDNGGGDYNAALKVLDYFLDDCDLIQVQSAHLPSRTEHSKPGAETIPMVVLVNQNSASSAEIVTSALKDNHRATILGTVTYGKGIIQSIYPLSDGGALKITTEQYLNLENEEIQGVGIIPDVIIENDNSEFEVDYADDGDAVYNRAIEILLKQLNLSAN